MNWTASLLREQLRKERLAYQKKIALLEQKEANLDQTIFDLQTNLKSSKLFSKQEKSQVNKLQLELTRIHKAKQKSEQQKQVLFNKIKHLNQALTANSQDKAQIQQELVELQEFLNKSKEHKETQTVINYQQIIKDKDQALKVLQSEKKNLLKTVSQKEKDLLLAESQQQEQLRKINLLFDDNANNYEIIDFNGLYELLKSIAERERESKRRQ